MVFLVFGFKDGVDRVCYSLRDGAPRIGRDFDDPSIVLSTTNRIPGEVRLTHTFLKARERDSHLFNRASVLQLLIQFANGHAIDFLRCSSASVCHPDKNEET